MPHGAAVAGIAVLVLFSVYRRIRRNIGFQRFARKRMITRMLIFAILGALLLVSGYRQPTVYIFDALGLVFGTVIAYFSIRTTSLEWRQDAWYYRPNSWIGMFLTVLFIARIAYRVVQDYELFQMTASASLAQQQQLASYSHDPTTSIILFTLIAYYLVYYVFLIGRVRHNNV